MAQTEWLKTDTAKGMKEDKAGLMKPRSVEESDTAAPQSPCNPRNRTNRSPRDDLTWVSESS